MPQDEHRETDDQHGAACREAGSNRDAPESFAARPREIHTDPRNQKPIGIRVIPPPLHGQGPEYASVAEYKGRAEKPAPKNDHSSGSGWSRGRERVVRFRTVRAPDHCGL